MAKVTFTLEGEIDEVMATLHGMAGNAIAMNDAQGSSNRAEAAVEAAPEPAPATETPAMPASPASATPAEPESGETVWNSGYVTAFWNHLSDRARQAMVRVSRSPNHTQKRAQLMHTLQLSQRELSGSLSSQGHSLNRLKRRRRNINLPRPLTYDRLDDVYILDANFAEAMGELGLS